MIIKNVNDVSLECLAATLVCRFHHGESLEHMNAATMEGILVSHFTRGTMKRLPKKLEKLDSKKAALAWEQGKRMEGLQMLGEVAEELLSNGDTAVRTFRNSKNTGRGVRPAAIFYCT